MRKPVDQCDEATREMGTRSAGSRAAVFRVLLVLIPVLLLGLVEGALRLRGVGGYPPLVRPIFTRDGRTLMETDPEQTQSYFFHERPGRGSARPSAFYDPKGSNVVRIVLAGESAILGYPQPRPLTVGTFLERALESVWPGRDVEIINLGTTAVASFPVYDMAMKIMRYDPDLVIVYAGNNEFFGAYGVCSSHFAGSHPFMMRISRAVRGLGIVCWSARAFTPRVAESRETLMERMIGRQYVPAQSKLRRIAAGNLGHHVGLIIETGRKAGVPVMVCTLASNERGLFPFGRPDAGPANAEAVDELNARLRKLRGMIEADGDAVAKELKAVVASYPQHAHAHFLLGEALHHEQRFEEATAYFQKAVDLDTMPWRPTSLQNESLVRIATGKGALLCDVRAMFRRLSPGGSIGWELMDDHVHPSLAGQYMLALCLVRSLTQAQGRLHVPEAEVRKLPSWRIAAAGQGANVYEEYAAAHLLSLMFRAAFYRESNPEAAAGMEQRLAGIARGFDPAIAAPFMAAMEQRAVDPSAVRPASAVAARLLIAGRRYAEAAPLLDFARASRPEFAKDGRLYAALRFTCLQMIGETMTQAREAEIRREIDRGETLLKYGVDHSGTTDLALWKMYEMLGESGPAAMHRQQALGKDPGIEDLWHWSSGRFNGAGTQE